jgi:hypothetical protein
MPNTNPTAYDIFEFALGLSNVTDTAYDPVSVSELCQSILEEEGQSGGDRSRQALSIMVTLNYPYLLADPTSVAHHAAGIGALLLEMTIRLSRPKSILFTAFTYRGLDINHTTLQEVGTTRVDIINNTNLDYVERFWNLSFDEDNLVLQQDIQAGTVGKTYDLIAVYLEAVISEDQMLLNLAEMLNPGGTLFLMGTSDAAAIYTQMDANPFYRSHELLKSIDGINLFFIPFGIGYTMAVKSL